MGTGREGVTERKCRKGLMEKVAVGQSPEGGTSHEDTWERAPWQDEDGLEALVRSKV